MRDDDVVTLNAAGEVTLSLHSSFHTDDKTSGKA